MRATIVGCCLLVTARVEAEPYRDIGTLVMRWIEYPDSIGPIVGIGFDGRPSVGGTGRISVAQKFGIDGQVRSRDGALAADVELAWTFTYGKLRANYGARSVYPINLSVLAGVGVVESRPAATFALALRARVADRISVDLIFRDALTTESERPHDVTRVPEIQLAVSLTAAHGRRECEMVPGR